MRTIFLVRGYFEECFPVASEVVHESHFCTHFLTKLMRHVMTDWILYCSAVLHYVHENFILLSLL